MTDKPAPKSLQVIAIMSLYFFVPSMGIVLASFASIAAAFPNVPFTTITYLATIVGLAQIPAALFAGWAAGRHFKYKTLTVFSMVLFVLAGTAPYFATSETSFGLILLSRVLFGIALGIFSPIANALIVKLFDEEQKRANMLGFGNVMFNVGAIVTQMLGGFLCLISWQTTFLAHLLGIVALVLVMLFLKEPRQEQDLKGEKVKVPGIAFAYMSIFTITLMCTYPLMTLTSMIMAEAGLGDAALAGTLLSLFTVAGAITAALFGAIYRATRKWILPISALVIAVGFFIVYTASATGSANLALFIVGMMLVGVGLTGITIGTPMLVSMATSAAAATAGMGFVAAFMNLGSFLSSPYMTLVGSVTGQTSPRFMMLASGVLVLVFSAVLVLVVARVKQGVAVAEASEV